VIGEPIIVGDLNAKLNLRFGITSYKLKQHKRDNWTYDIIPGENYTVVATGTLTTIPVSLHVD